MNEKQLGKPSLNADAPPGVVMGARQIADRILNRDGRRVRLLIVLTAFFWVLAGTGVFFVLHVVTWRLYPHEQKLMQDAALGKLTLEKLAEIQAKEFQAAEFCARVIGTAFLALSLAFLCAILLILASRRATLLQINASLAAISEQLQSLPRSPPAPTETAN
jgi:phage shock protein PspC (stress-responsive transcriptional regulator)